MSINDWVRKSGWLSLRKSITLEDIKGYITVNPDLIKAWLGYSSDQRCSPAWYFIENNKEMTSFTVGYFESNLGRTKETKYSDSIEACAQFILNQFNAISKHLK